MGTLQDYIRNSLRDGHSYSSIKEALQKKGYSKQATKGILLSYQISSHRIALATTFILAIMLASALYLTGSGILGYATMQYAPEYTDAIELVTSESGELSWVPSIPGELASLTVTGNLIGKGSAQIILDTGSTNFTVLNTILNPSTEISSRGERILHFEHACRDTCFLEGLESPLYTLSILVNDAEFDLHSLTYQIRTEGTIEAIPHFTEIPSQVVGVGGKVTLDLESYFVGDADSYTFLTDNEVAEILLEDSQVTIIARRSGESHIYFIARHDGATTLSNLFTFSVESREDATSLYLEGTSPELPNVKTQNTLWLGLPILLAVLGVLIVLLLPKHFLSLSPSINRVEEKLAKLEEQFPKLEALKTFHTLLDKTQTASKKKEKDASYRKLEKVYEKLMKSDLSKKDKQIIYKEMSSLYDSLNHGF